MLEMDEKFDTYELEKVKKSPLELCIFKRFNRNDYCNFVYRKKIKK